MVCPKRKFLMVGRMIKDREKKKDEETDGDEITEEEHQERIKKLKEQGILK